MRLGREVQREDADGAGDERGPRADGDEDERVALRRVGEEDVRPRRGELEPRENARVDERRDGVDDRVVQPRERHIARLEARHGGARPRRTGGGGRGAAGGGIGLWLVVVVMDGDRREIGLASCICAAVVKGCRAASQRPTQRCPLKFLENSFLSSDMQNSKMTVNM